MNSSTDSPSQYYVLADSEEAVKFGNDGLEVLLVICRDVD